MMLPVPMMDSWSLYVVDVKERTLLVMDPCETSELQEEMKYKHEDNANIIPEGLRRCIHANIPGWHVPSQGWSVIYNVGMHPSCEIEDSYLHVMNYISEFTGVYIYNPLTPNRLHYFRRLIAYDVISMRGNRAEIPVRNVDQFHQAVHSGEGEMLATIPIANGDVVVVPRRFQFVPVLSILSM